MEDGYLYQAFCDIRDLRVLTEVAAPFGYSPSLPNRRQAKGVQIWGIDQRIKL